MGGPLAAGLLASQTHAQPILYVTHVNALHLTPLYVAKEQGFFAKEGLTVEMLGVSAGSHAALTLLAKEAQFSSATNIGETVLLRQQGKHLVRIYSIANRMTMDLVVRNEVIEAKGLSRDLPIMQRFKALKGMDIGVTAEDVLDDVALRYYLEKARLGLGENIFFTFLGTVTTLAQAFRAGEIDALMLPHPTPLLLEEEGFGKIIIKSSAGDVPAFVNFEHVGITVTKEWAEEHEREVRAFVRAMNAANRFWRENLTAVVDAAEKLFPRIPREIVQLSIEALKDSLSPDGLITPFNVIQYMDILHTMEPKQFPREALNPSEGIHWTNRYNPNGRK